MKNISVALLALAGSLVATGASAADILAIDLGSPAQTQAIDWSSPTAGFTHLLLTPYVVQNRRSAFSQAAPLSLPCDVDILSSGIAWKNISSQAVYVEMSASIFYNGDEHRPLANVYGQVEPHAPISTPVAAGAVAQGGFIFLTHPPLYDFTVDASLADAALAYMSIPGYESLPAGTLAANASGYIPANMPLKIWYRVRAFSSDAYDFTRGGYDMANVVSDSVTWDDCYTTWVQRTCP